MRSVGGILAFALQLPGDGEQGQNEIAVVLGLVPHVGQAASGERPKFASILQNFFGHGRPHRVLGQAGDEGEPGCFYGVVAVVDGN